MLLWELKKIAKSNSGKIAVGIMGLILILHISFKSAVEGYGLMAPSIMILWEVIILVLLSDIYTKERGDKMTGSILSSKGKYKALRSKIWMGFIIPVCAAAINILMFLFISFIQRGSKCGDVISEGVGFKMMFVVLIFLLTGIGAVFFSFISKDVLFGTLSMILFMLSGKVIVFVKWIPDEIRGLLSIGNMPDMITKGWACIGKDIGKMEMLGTQWDIRLLIAVGYIGFIISIFVFSIFRVKKIQE